MLPRQAGAKLPIAALLSAAAITFAAAGAGCEEDSTPPGFEFNPIEASVDLPDARPVDAARDDGAVSDAEAGPPACKKVFYLLSVLGDLSIFDPVTLAETDVGHVPCIGNGPEVDDAYSMTVDASGNGWVSRRFKHDLLRIDLRTLECKPTAFTANQQGWNGPMKLAFRGPKNAEELFVLDSGRQTSGAIVPSKGLGTIDLTTFALTPKAPLSGAYAGKEGPIAFTATGELYGLFFVTGGTDLVRIDPATGETSSPVRFAEFTRNVDSPIAALGDDLWLFSTSSPDGGPGDDQRTVRRYNLVTKQTTIVKELTRFVVGAQAACTSDS